MPTVKDISNADLEKRFAVSVPRADFDGAIEQRAKAMQPQIKIPGFRPGRVPVPVIRERYHHDLMRETMQNVINDNIRTIMQDHKLDIIGYPDINLSPPKSDANIDFTVLFVLKPQVPDIDFSTIDLTRPVLPITDAVLTRELEALAQSKREFTPRKDTEKAKDHDRLTIDCHCRPKGEKDVLVQKAEFFQLGQKPQRPLEKMLEKHLLGTKKGQTVKFPFTFPKKDIAPELAGKEAHFEVVVTKIEAVREYAVNAALAQSFGLKTLAELKNTLREQLERRNAAPIQNYLHHRLTVMLSHMYDFPISRYLVEKQSNEHVQQRNMELQQRDGKQSPPVLSKQKQAALHHDMARRLRFGLAVSHIGKMHNIQVDMKEVETIINTYLRQENDTPERRKAFAPGGAVRQKLEARLFEDKVLDFVIGKARVKDKVMTEKQFAKVRDEAEKESQALMVNIDDDTPAKGRSAKSRLMAGASKDPDSEQTQSGTRKTRLDTGGKSGSNGVTASKRGGTPKAKAAAKRPSAKSGQKPSTTKAVAKKTKGTEKTRKKGISS